MIGCVTRVQLFSCSRTSISLFNGLTFTGHSCSDIFLGEVNHSLFPTPQQDDKCNTINAVGRDPIERLHFLAPGTGAREGGEKTQPFNGIHSRLFMYIVYICA